MRFSIGERFWGFTASENETWSVPHLKSQKRIWKAGNHLWQVQLTSLLWDFSVSLKKFLSIRWSKTWRKIFFMTFLARSQLLDHFQFFFCEMPFSCDLCAVIISRDSHIILARNDTWEKPLVRNLITVIYGRNYCSSGHLVMFIKRLYRIYEKVWCLLLCGTTVVSNRGYP